MGLPVHLFDSEDSEVVSGLAWDSDRDLLARMGRIGRIKAERQYSLTYGFQ